MAVSPIFIRRLKRMIERLRDKHRLSREEEIELSEMLDEDEKVEAERRRQEIFHINSMMAMQLEEFPKGEELWWSNEMNRYREAWVAVRYRVPSIERYTAQRSGEGARMGHEHKQCLVDNLFTAFDNLKGMAKLAMTHRGPRIYENLPQWIESAENLAWPNHPNANRQAHIEVLEMKLERLIREAGNL